jgi:hypothetical protein
MAVDHALSMPLASFVDFDAGRRIVVAALTAENLQRILQRHAAPGFDRYTARVSASPETLGGLVPQPARERIRHILDHSKPPRARWAKKLVDPALVRRLFAPVWVNLFTSFAKRMPIPGVAAVTAAAAATGAAGSGIAGRLSRSVQERAEKLVDRGRSAMGGLGAEVEKRVQAAARDFSDGAAEIFREAMADRLKSAEGREIVAEITTQVFDRLMAAKLVDLHEDARQADVPEILAAASEIVGHSVTRSFIAETILGEVTEFVAFEGQRPLREILEELGILGEVRGVAVARITETARGLFAEPGFADWIGRLLDA